MPAARTSPLSLEERAHLSQLFEHDFHSQLGRLSEIAISGHNGQKSDLAEALTTHLRHVLESYNLLASTPEKFYLSEVDGSYFNQGIETLRRMMPRKAGQITAAVAKLPKFDTSPGMVYVTMCNLAKNAFDAAPDASVQFTVDIFSGDVPDIVYCPDGAVSGGTFVRIAAHDNGPGFSLTRPLASYLELGASTHENGGFGLFFVKMVAKYLQAPLAIHSEPGNTSVVLYHPFNLG